jgi:adenylate kinase family enzyme
MLTSQSQFGKIAEKFLEKKRLLPSKLMVELLAAELGRTEGRDILLVGFPRNQEQALLL